MTSKVSQRIVVWVAACLLPIGFTISARADQVIPDDLIVQGSACVGFDCVNGESFGFDTIRLKENNLRIKAQDTSNSASFPTNDWQITFNDSTNGGANKFSIDDIDGGRTPFTIIAGARTNALFVNSAGKIGIGTSTPVVDLHVKTGNTPTLRLEQDGTSGFTAQTWDVAGNEANFFIRDVTNGSTLSFRIRPGAPSSAIDVAANGNVNINSSSTFTQDLGIDGDLFVKRTASNENTGVVIEGPANGSANIALAEAGNIIWAIQGRNVQAGASPDPLVFFNEAGQRAIELSQAGGLTMLGGGTYNPATGAWVDLSSREYKENITDLSAADAQAAFEALQPKTFNFKRDENKELKVGFIAEDVPELVATRERNGLSAIDIVAVLTKVVQGQQQQIDQLNKQVQDLSKEK